MVSFRLELGKLREFLSYWSLSLDLKKHLESGKFEFRFLKNILSQESLSLDFEKKS